MLLLHASHWSDLAGTPIRNLPIEVAALTLLFYLVGHVVQTTGTGRDESLHFLRKLPLCTYEYQCMRMHWFPCKSGHCH